MPHQLRQGVEEIVHADDHFMVIRPDRLGDLPRIPELAVLFFAVADGKRLHRTVGHALDQGRNRARIDAAREEHSERHIAHQAHSDGLFQTPPALLDPALFGTLLDYARLRYIPVTVELRLNGFVL